jgi:hypothetical protein
MLFVRECMLWLPSERGGLLRQFAVRRSILVNILIIFNISNIDKEINKELPEDDLLEDRNMLQCFLKCFK